MSFPDRIEAVLLAGGQLEPLPEGERVLPGKGLLKIGTLPMAARALRALVESPRIHRITLVSPVGREELGPEWEGVDEVAPAGKDLMASLKSGLSRVLRPEDPVLTVAGDLPFLTGESVTDFLDQCSARPEASVWYGYMRREVSERKFPGIRHTWARLVEGTFCGTGLVGMRPQIVERMQAAMHELAAGRKNPLRLAATLGWGTVFAFALRQLTVKRAETAARRLLGVECAGIESPYPETAFNVDSPETLIEARKLAARQAAFQGLKGGAVEAS